jgi:hypothetical protein
MNGAPYGVVQGAVLKEMINPAFDIGLTSPGFSGQVRNLMVWNTALTADDIMKQMWSNAPLETSSIVLATDFTWSPPRAIKGPAPITTNTYFQMEATCLRSASPLSPGPATTIDPTGPSPFSLIGWIQAGQPWQPTVSAVPEPITDPTPFGQGCIFSNRDQTDAEHMALMLDQNGVLTGQFGAGSAMQTVAASSAPIPQHQWACVGLSYDGMTCTLYVNGVAAGSGAIVRSAPSSAAAPKVAGRLTGGAPIDVFHGVLQYLSVWNIALTADQMSTYMYSNPTGVKGCVADFSGSDSPPQDLLQLENAIWDANVLVPAATTLFHRGYSTIGAYSAGVNRPSLTDAAPELPAKRRVRFRNPFSSFARKELPIAPYSDEHRALAIAQAVAAASTIPSGLARQALLAGFEQALADAFAAAQNGTLPPRPSPPRSKARWSGFSTAKAARRSRSSKLIIRRNAWPGGHRSSTP